VKIVSHFSSFLIWAIVKECKKYTPKPASLEPCIFDMEGQHPQFPLLFLKLTNCPVLCTSYIHMYANSHNSFWWIIIFLSYFFPSDELREHLKSQLYQSCLWILVVIPVMTLVVQTPILMILLTLRPIAAQVVILYNLCFVGFMFFLMMRLYTIVLHLFTAFIYFYVY
jgi:hypothetical protein